MLHHVLKKTIYQDLCVNGDCESQFIVVYENQEILPNANGHYEVEWNGLEYFQVKGQLSHLNSDYCNADGIPFIETRFDSDYWVVFENLYFTTPMYSYLGWFNDQGLKYTHTIWVIYLHNDRFNKSSSTTKCSRISNSSKIFVQIVHTPPL